MKTNRTIRYRLYPATYQKHQKLHGTAGACRYVWNHFVGKLRDEYEYYGESNYHFFTIGKQFTTLRKHCDTWLQKYSSYIVKPSLRPIETAYKEFFKGNRGLPKFHGRNTHTPSFPINYQSAKISGTHIFITKVGWMKFGGGDRYKGEKFVSGQVKYECGKWYAYIVYEIEISDKPHLLTAVGLDRNCGQVALSDGTIHHVPDIQKKIAKRKRYQRKYARGKQGSNRRKVVKYKLQKAHKAERNARANWYHQTSKLIADEYDIVYMEELNTQGMTKSAKGTIESPFVAMATNGVTLWRTLTWVCRSDKLRLVLNSGYSKNHPARLRLPHYTSQTCNQCGSVDKANRKTQSIFKCQQCGHEDNADVNAALNILAAGNTATGRGDGGISRSVKCQKNEIAGRANQLAKLTT